MLICAFAKAQTPVSRATLTTTPYSWINRLVPTSAYLKNTFSSFWNVVDDGIPLTPTTGWSITGNAIATNTNFIGTTNNRSLLLRANSTASTSYVKIDSLGHFNWRLQNTDPFSPNNFTIRKWPTLGTYAAIYFNQASFLGTNYFLLGDTNATILNGPKQLLFNTGHRRFMSATSTYTSGGTILTLDAITNTLIAANAELRHFTVAGSITYYANGGTTALNRGNLFSAETHSTLTGETATITNDVGNEFNVPTGAGGLTQTNSWAISCKGNQNITTQLSIGSSLLPPTARLHLAAGNATMAAIQLTSQTLLTATVQGSIERNSGILYWTNAAMRTEVGQILKASATLNFPSTAAGAVADLTIAVTNAALNDVVSVGAPNGSVTATGMYYAWVSATDVVTVRFLHTHLTNAEDPASGTFKVTVSKN